MTENEMVDRIIKSLDEKPEEWEFDSMTAWNGPLHIWIVPYQSCFIWRPVEVRIGFWSGRRLRRATTECARKKVLLALDTPQKPQEAPCCKKTQTEGDSSPEV